jgi:hypothetical protein
MGRTAGEYAAAGGEGRKDVLETRRRLDRALLLSGSIPNTYTEILIFLVSRLQGVLGWVGLGWTGLD